DLAEKVEAASEILKSCRFCERRCGIDRTKGERGFCRVLEPSISSEFLHFGEESELVPSYTIFFSGCTFKCVFCQNWDISQNPDNGVHIKAETLAKMIDKTGGINVNWVGGDPTPNLLYILEVISMLKRNIPQVWNSNMYLTEEAMNLLDGVIDLYLTDFKYGCDRCAKKLSDAPRYWGITTRNHLHARERAELIIRHLVMPGHLDCCTKQILAWISENLGDTVRVNVMDQYRPEYKAHRFQDINRSLDRKEYQEAIEHAQDLGLNLCD
ncbi:MAG: radical SAM protein, partial [Candidatus Thorarchaeota archaeon]